MKITILIVALFAATAIGPALAGVRGTSVRDEPVPSPTRGIAETVREYLLTSAAADFHAHQPPMPARFRKVRLGHLASGDKISYRLCGEFLPQGKKAWLTFATIKTSGYEQYIGDGPLSYCSDKKMVWDTKADLSSTLKTRLDAIH